MKSYSIKTLASTLAALGFLSAAGAVQAATFEVDYTTAGAFSGVPPGSPGSNTVFATAIFDDHGGSGSVTLTMNVLNNLSAGAYVNDWYFNVSSAPLGNIALSSGVAASSIDFTVPDSYKADGTGGGFDFAFHFPTSNPGELGQGHTSVYTLTGAGITANSFDSNSVSLPPAANNGGFVSAIHVQGYGNSVWIAGSGGGGGGAEIPEPATLALLGLGLFGVAVTRRRRA